MKKMRFVGVLGAAISLIFVLAACDSGGGTSSSTSNADLLKTAAQNMKAAKSYTISLTASQAGQDVKMSGDVDVANNKSKLDMSAAGQSINATTIGSDSYVSTDGGKTYTRTDASSGPASGVSSFTKLWDNFNAADIDKAKDAIKDGSPREETVGSDATRHITASTKDLASLSPGGAGAGTTDGTIDMWLTTGATPTVRKMLFKGTSGGQDINATVEWTNIGKSFTIDAPPVATP